MIGKLWPILIGFGIWAAAFVMLYAVQGLGCALGWPESNHRAVLLAIWIASVSALGMLLLWQWRLRADGKLSAIALPATLAAKAATIVTCFPVTFATLCL